MPVPTRRLALVAVAAAIVIALAPDSWPGVPETLPVGPWDFPGPVVLVNAVLLAVAALDAALAGRPADIEIEREMPRALALDVRAPVTWHVRNPGKVRRTVSFGDEFAPSLRAEVRRARVALPARGRATVGTEIMPARRGDFLIEELVVRVEGPLGLGARQASRSLPSLLRVLPPFRSRDDADLRINKARILEVGLRSSRSLGSGTEFDQLREYARRRVPKDRLVGNGTGGSANRAYLSLGTEPTGRVPAGQRAGDGWPGCGRSAGRARDGCSPYLGEGFDWPRRQVRFGDL